MKKIMFLFLIFTTMALSQNFTIRSLTGRTSSNLTGTDVFLISNSAGALTKVSYTNMMANLDDEAFTWTGTHAFNGNVDFNATTSITGGTFYIQNVKTATTAGELANTSSHVYLKYKGTQEDTLATWRHIWQDNITIYGQRVYSGAAWSKTGAGDFSLLGSGNVINQMDNAFSLGDITFANNSINFATTASVVMAGLISYPTGADIVPTATWDVSGLPQVVVVLVNSDVTVTSMTGAVDGQILHIIGGDTQGDYVTIQDNSTINLDQDEDFILDEQWCSITLIYTEQNTNEWTEISRQKSASGGVYGTMGFADSSLTISVASSSIYYPITNPTNNLYTDGVEVGDLVWTGDSIQVTTAGNYEVLWELGMSGANTDVYHVTLWINNVKQAGKGEAEVHLSIGDVINLSSHTIVAVGATNWVSLRIRNLANTNDPTVHSGNISITKK